MRVTSLLIVILMLGAAAGLCSDLTAFPQDLHTPTLTSGEPAPGQRVRAVTTGYESTTVYQ